VVFDLDGTLVDSRQDLANSVNAMLGEFGRAPLPEAEVTGMVGEGARVLVERALAARGIDETAAPECLRRFLALYDERLLDHTRAYEGIPELLDALHGRAVLTVLTNKPGAASRRILKGLDLSRFFEAVIGGDSEHPRKPDPAALLRLIERFGATRDATLMVGDSPIDLETAQNAGVRACLVRYGFGFRFEAAELRDVLVADSPLDVERIVGGDPARRARDAR
jgi:phosphoglycolate phosphatase